MLESPCLLFGAAPKHAVQTPLPKRSPNNELLCPTAKSHQRCLAESIPLIPHPGPRGKGYEVLTVLRLGPPRPVTVTMFPSCSPWNARYLPRSPGEIPKPRRTRMNTPRQLVRIRQKLLSRLRAAIPDSFRLRFVSLESGIFQAQAMLIP
jgi:hypothetical protein